MVPVFGMLNAHADVDANDCTQGKWCFTPSQPLRLYQANFRSGCTNNISVSALKVDFGRKSLVVTGD